MENSQPKRWSTRLSLRTLLFVIATSALSFGVFARPDNLTGAIGTTVDALGLLALLLGVCITFASVADDVWQDPASAFVGGQ